MNIYIGKKIDNHIIDTIINGGSLIIYVLKNKVIITNNKHDKSIQKSNVLISFDKNDFHIKEINGQTIIYLVNDNKDILDCLNEENMISSFDNFIILIINNNTIRLVLNNYTLFESDYKDIGRIYSKKSINNDSIKLIRFDETTDLTTFEEKKQ